MLCIWWSGLFSPAPMKRFRMPLHARGGPGFQHRLLAGAAMSLTILVLAQPIVLTLPWVPGYGGSVFVVRLLSLIPFLKSINFWPGGLAHRWQTAIVADQPQPVVCDLQCGGGFRRNQPLGGGRRGDCLYLQ